MGKQNTSHAPHDYLRVIAATLPKQFETAPAKPVEELTDAELTAFIRDKYPKT
jgi:hypothetical protein